MVKCVRTRELKAKGMEGRKEAQRGQLKSIRLKAERKGCGKWKRRRLLGGEKRGAAVGKQGQCLCLCRLCHCGILEDRGAVCLDVCVCVCVYSLPHPLNLWN